MLKSKRKSISGAAADEYEWGSAKVLDNIDLHKLPRKDLRNHLLARDLSVEGNKKELLERLEESLEQERLTSIAYNETIESEFQIQKDLEERGSVYAIGSNWAGQLGQGDLEPRPIFTVVPKTQGAGICTLTTGFDLVFAVTEDHDVFTWGGQGSGPMGHPEDSRDDPTWNEERYMEPDLVKRLTGEDIVQVKVGASHAVALSKGGDLFVWGHNKCGQLGFGDFKASHEPEVCSGIPDGCSVADFSVGENHSAIVAVTTEQQKRIYTWGHVADGRLGLGVRERLGATSGERFFFPAPTMVDELYKEKVVQVSCGRTHTLARTVHGVWSWGHGGGGRLGHGDQRDQFKPKLVEAFQGMIVLDVCAATWHNAAIIMVPPLRGCGEVYTWGSGYHGQLGQGLKQISLTPALVSYISKKQLYATQICCGSHHNAIITHEGELWTWGSNKDKCLGRDINETEVEYTPVPGYVAGFGALVDRVGRGMPRSVACGKEFTIVATYPYEGPTEAVAKTLIEEEALRAEEERIQREEEEAEKARVEKMRKREEERAVREAVKKAQRDKELGLVEGEHKEAEASAKTRELLEKRMKQDDE